VRSVNPLRELRRFESFTCHRAFEAPRPVQCRGGCSPSGGRRHDCALVGRLKAGYGPRFLTLEVFMRGQPSPGVTIDPRGGAQGCEISFAETASTWLGRTVEVSRAGTGSAMSASSAIRGPAVLDCGGGVPLPLGGVVELVQPHRDVAPGQASNSSLDDRGGCPGFGETLVVATEGRSARGLTPTRGTS